MIFCVDDEPSAHAESQKDARKKMMQLRLVTTAHLYAEPLSDLHGSVLMFHAH